MSIREFAEKFIEAEKQAFKQGNFDALKAIEAPDVIYHWGTVRDMAGHEAHVQDIMEYRRRTSSHVQEWDYIVGDGDVCVLSIKERMTFAKEFPIISAPAGATVEFSAFFVLRRENDRVAEGWIMGSGGVVDQK